MLAVQLAELEVTRYRSIRHLDKPLTLDGLDCLVGKNNAGKTNIMAAAKFLLGEDNKSNDEELFWQRKTDKPVEVRGFFEVTNADLDRIPQQKREAVEAQLIDHGDHQGQLGVCRQAEFNDGRVMSEFKLLQWLPADGKYTEQSFKETRDRYWCKATEGDTDFTKTNYRDEMQSEYEEVARHVSSGKEKNKGAWKDAYDDYVNSYPEQLEYELQPTGFDGTKTVIRDNLLPKVLTVPAIKPVDSTTNKRGEFGSLLTEVSKEIGDEINQEIQDKLSEFDLRSYDAVEAVENAVSEELNAAFANQSVRFEFPSLSAQYLFDDADIEIDDDQIESLSKENVGEGVKRTLIFSLVRTLANIRGGSVLSDQENDDDSRPLLLCYEEADLFLHPSLQKKLLQTFEGFADDGDQVLFSTHSPVMVQRDPLGTINIVQKRDGATTVTQFHEVLQERSEEEQSRLTDLQSVSAYVFADTVVLVEGPTDRIVFQKLSEKFGGSNSFQSSSVSLLAAGGKGEVKVFYQFLRDLNIETFAVFDIDAVYDGGGDGHSTIERMFSNGSFPALTSLREDIERQRDGERAYDEDAVPERPDQKPWEQTANELEELVERVLEGGELSRDDAEPIDRVINDIRDDGGPAKHMWVSDEAQPERVDLVKSLFERNVLLLSGDIEDYYPGNGDKRSMALKFKPSEYTKSELRENFQSLGEETDIERFLNDVLGDEKESSTDGPSPKSSTS